MALRHNNGIFFIFARHPSPFGAVLHLNLGSRKKSPRLQGGVGFINYAQIPNSLSARETFVLNFCSLPRRYAFFPNTYLICVCAETNSRAEAAHKRVIKSGKCFCSFRRPGCCRGCARSQHSPMCCRWSELMGRWLHSRPESSTCTHYLFSRRKRERESWLVGKDQSANSSPRCPQLTLWKLYIFRQLK